MTFERIKAELSTKTVGIAGCGGLGSNVANALVRTGIGRLIIVDFDVVNESNLNRQFFFYHQIGEKKAFALQRNLKLINPNVDIEAFDQKLNRDSVIDVFSKADLIIEAFDQKEMKEMLIDSLLTNSFEKKIICASGLAGLDHCNELKIIEMDSLILVGDFQTEVSIEEPPLAPKVYLAAAMQANIAIRVLLGLSAK